MEILADKMHGSAWKSTFKAIDALVEKSTQCNQPHPSKTLPILSVGRQG
jgi:hypothetical protein